MSEKRKGAMLCGHEGKWKEELEERLQTDERVTLLAIGRVKYKLLAYLWKRKDREVVKLETRYMKNRDKDQSQKTQQPQTDLTSRLRKAVFTFRIGLRT